MLTAIATQARRVVRKVAGTGYSEADLFREYFADRAPGTMLDVGAHYGESHRWYLKRGWNVLAFEPDPANRAKIRLNVGPGRLTILDCAVSDYQLAAAEYFASSESTGISALAPFVPTHRPVCTVAVRTLSSVLSESTIDRCDFLKIDTEGHDLFVLRGFPWDRLIPDAVLCEFENRKTIPLGYTHQALGDFLLEQGYAVYLSEWAPIVRYGADHSWRRLVRYPAPLLDGAGWGNFVAFRDDKPLPDRVKRWLEKRQSQ